MILDDWRENPQECAGLSHPILLGILGKISPKQTISGTFRRPICWTNDQDERESPTGMDVTQTCPSNRSPKSYRTSELASWAVATAQTSIGTSRYWWDFDLTFPDFSECLWPMRALGRFLALALLPPLLFVAPGRRATGVPGGCRGRSLARHVQRNPYDVLGLSSGCSYDDIRAAFRKLARSWWIFWGPKWQNGGDQKVFFLLKLGRIRINLLSIKVWVALFSDKPKLGIWKKTRWDQTTSISRFSIVAPYPFDPWQADYMQDLSSWCSRPCLDWDMVICGWSSVWKCILMLPMCRYVPKQYM